MIHDTELLDRLSELPTESFGGEVYRATRRSLDPLLASASGGRWGLPGGPSVLYTSLAREGALAEISYHWSQYTPRPSKPAMLHVLRVSARQTLRLIRADLALLGVPADAYSRPNQPRTQEIGAAVEFLGCDGLIAPCARWDCENLMLFPDSASFRGTLEPLRQEEVDWLQWARDNNFVAD